MKKIFKLFIMVLGQYPAALQRWKFDAPLLAAGLLTDAFSILRKAFKIEKDGV